jgi:radical SAM superfamily enzyme YgiQ (UPF0313 family)
MKIVFVAPTPPDLAAFGVRTLSAYLKQHGHTCRCIFLPGGVEKYKYGSRDGYRYEARIVGQVLDLCRGHDLIAMSFMSNYLDRASQLARALREGVKVPLVVGGIHPTVLPEPCLEFADIVCVGEGEEALLELVQRIEAGCDYADVRNLWLRRDGQIVRNPVRPLIEDLDRLPYYDFGPEEHFVFNNVTRNIDPMTKELLRKSFPQEPNIEGSFSDSYRRTLSYKTMTTRGCPHHCTFCAEKTLSDMYSSLGQHYLRKRSIPHIMGELEWARRELPFIESIFLFDDTFLVRPASEIRELARAYKASIGLPMHIQASPTTITEEKIECLVDAGLAFVEMGIQSTSEHGRQIYRRTVPTVRILEAARILRQFTGRINTPCYHVILDNPWETTEDVLETLDTVLRLPRPFWLKRASLVCFPGTELYIRAEQDGILKTEEDYRREIYNKHLHQPKGRYVNFLMYLAGFSSLPRWIVRGFARQPLVRLLERPRLGSLYLWLNRLGDNLIVFHKGIRSLFLGDFSRIRKYFVRRTSGAS